jgi:glycosyltransferase involved in cell wall biosynthesis
MFAGGGPDLDLFRSIAYALPSAAHILMPGQRSDIARLIDGADVVVVPSTYQDALPLSVIEGMVHEKPVIGTTVGGIPEMLRDELEGILVPPGDVDALAAAILRLAADAPLRAQFGARGRARVLSDFSPERMVGQVVNQIDRGFHGDGAR